MNTGTVLRMFSGRSRWNLQPNEFSLAIERQRSSASGVLDLTASNPTTVGFDYDEEAILSAMNNRKSLTYEPDPRGLLSAREAVVHYYNEVLPAADIDERCLILTVSTSEAYSYAFRLLCDPGDEILVAAPSYPLFEYLAEIQDVQLVSYELVYDHGWQIDFHSLRQKLTARTRAIVLVNPNNPTGSYISGQEKTELNQIAAEDNLALIVDEVFLDFALDGARHFSLFANQDALTFTLSGISKICALPQMKLSWLAVSGPAQQKREAMDRLEVIADTYLSPSAPIQHALGTLLETRAGIQTQITGRLRQNLAELDRQLAAQQLCSRLQVQGGWYAVLRVPVTQSDEQLATELVEQQSVVVHPGHFFDFHVDGYLIVSLITPEREFSEGIRRVLSFFH